MCRYKLPTPPILNWRMCDTHGPLSGTCSRTVGARGVEEVGRPSEACGNQEDPSRKSCLLSNLPRCPSRCRRRIPSLRTCCTASRRADETLPSLRDARGASKVKCDPTLQTLHHSRPGLCMRSFKCNMHKVRICIFLFNADFFKTRQTSV